jgi:hypothetical protein
MRKIEQDELGELVKLHKEWLYDSEKGKRLILKGFDLRYSNLSGSDLSFSDLSYSDLSGSDLRYSNLRGSNLHGSNLIGSNLSDCDLSYSDLSGSDLRYSNLRGSDLDFSCFPLRRGGSKFIADDRLIAQVLAHLCTLDVSPKAQAELDKIREFAKTSHIAKDLGLL